MTQDALKQMYQLLLTEPHAPTVCAQLERIAREALADHAMQEVQRLGQEIEQEPKIKTTDPFESSKVADYNRGWNDCLFASGIVKQPEQEPKIGCVNHDCDQCKAQPEQEPVGVVHHKLTSTLGADYEQVAVFVRPVEQGTKLYTSPPQRKPLTDEAQVLRCLLGAALGALRYHTEQTRPIQRTTETIAAIEHEMAAHGIKEKT